MAGSRTPTAHGMEAVVRQMPMAEEDGGCIDGGIRKVERPRNGRTTTTVIMSYVQPTSLSSLCDLLHAGHGAKQERTLLTLWLESPTEGYTDKECQRATGIPASTVSARRNGLMTRWAIERLPMQFVSSKRRCTVTQRTVLAWHIEQGTGRQAEFAY